MAISFGTFITLNFAALITLLFKVFAKRKLHRGNCYSAYALVFTIAFFGYQCFYQLLLPLFGKNPADFSSLFLMSIKDFSYHFYLSLSLEFTFGQFLFLVLCWIILTYVCFYSAASAILSAKRTFDTSYLGHNSIISTKQVNPLVSRIYLVNCILSC